jgi:hypothetical protein
MKKQILMMLGLAIMPVIAMAAPDFSGSWVRDEARSEEGPHSTYWLTRGVDTRGDGASELMVEQDAKSLKVTKDVRMANNHVSYMLDGKPHTMTMETGLQTETTTATMQEDTLVVVTTKPYGGMPGNVSTEIRETWKLSADGKQLYITTTQNLPARTLTYTQAFNRQ